MDKQFSPYPEYDNLGLIEAGKMMFRVRKDLDAAAEVKTELEKRYDYICSRVLPPLMEDQELSSFRLDEEFDNKGIRVQDELYASQNAENFPALREWLLEHNEEHIIKETINAGTLKSLVKECIKKGCEYPAHLIKVTVVPKARFF